MAGTIADNVRLGAPEAPAAPGPVRAGPRRGGRAGPGAGAGRAAARACRPGEVRRVALARALLRIDCAGGQLLVLDEPTAGLDADAELVVLDELRRLGVGALVVSHRPAVLAAADRVVELRPDVPQIVGSTR